MCLAVASGLGSIAEMIGGFGFANFMCLMRSIRKTKKATTVVFNSINAIKTIIAEITRDKNSIIFVR
jgi:hypothetical protein